MNDKDALRVVLEIQLHHQAEGNSQTGSIYELTLVNK